MESNEILVARHIQWSLIKGHISAILQTYIPQDVEEERKLENMKKATSTFITHVEKNKLAE
jgi:hypothetical protein